jgi:DNA polymerase
VTDRDQIAAHLQFFADLGAAGVSRDAAWTDRVARIAPAPQSAAQDAVPADADAPKAMHGAPPAPAPHDESRTLLDEIRAEIGDCTRCKLCSLGRKQVVFGVGNPNAELMFVGEAPGADEDEQGEPFVGRAGQLLTKIIEAIGMQRSDVYIANVLKCRPPGNRAPEPDEVATCEPFLFKQIDSIRPKVIVALGTHAAHALLKIDTPISKIRGHVLDYRGGIKLVPTFHPAYLLRSPDRKRDVWEDMKKVRALLSGGD